MWPFKSKESKKGMSIDEIKKKISILRDFESKGDYLNKILKRKGFLKNKTINSLKQLREENYKKAFEKYLQKGEYEKGARVYMKEGHSEPTAYELIGDIANKSEHYEMAANMYSKASRAIAEDYKREDTAPFFGGAYVKRSLTLSDKKRKALEMAEGGKNRMNKLEKALTPIITIIGFLGAIFFLSNNITGNVISNLTLKASNIIGVVLLLVGLIGAFVYSRKK